MWYKLLRQHMVGYSFRPQMDQCPLRSQYSAPGDLAYRALGFSEVQRSWLVFVGDWALLVQLLGRSPQVVLDVVICASRFESRPQVS